MVPVEIILFIAAVLVLLAVFASKVSNRLGIPGLLVFLLLGMLAGSDGPGGIPFDNAWQAQLLGVVALCAILFAGGIDTSLAWVRPVMWSALSLSTLGVLLTAVVTGAAARYLLGLSWTEGLLLGSVVSSTDAAAVFAVLRSRQAALRGHTEPLLELESGSNDPMAVFLTLGFIALITKPGATPVDLLPMFALQMGIGAAAGLALGRASLALINRLKLEVEGLYPALTVGLMLLAYGGTTVIGGNGFLAVYLAGIVLGNGDFVQKRTLSRFHDGLAWLMQIVMFLSLGLLVFPSRLVSVIGPGLVLSAVLMFAARPIGVFTGLLFSKLGLREKTLVAWVGLRGAAPIMLATFPRLAGVPNADLYFNLVFFIVLTSVLLQGTTISLLARRLGLEEPFARKRQYPIEFLPSQKTTSDLVEVTIAGGSLADGRQIVDLHLPKSALVVVVARGDDFIAPRGGTVLKSGDSLLVLVEKADIEAVRAIAGAPAASMKSPAT